MQLVTCSMSQSMSWYFMDLDGATICFSAVLLQACQSDHAAAAALIALGPHTGLLDVVLCVKSRMHCMCQGQGN